MKREIKFRAWDKKRKEMFWPSMLCTYSDDNTLPLQTIRFQGDSKNDFVLMQYTGLKDKQGNEIYEGDIFRVEEDGVEDGDDRIYYLVVVWVAEWVMFCTLRIADEYFDYQHGGVKALDEPMFWTYTLEDTNDRRFYLCGNIYEHPELLKR